MPEYCEVKVRGQLGQYWSEWFSGLKLTPLDDDVCLLSGELPDQAALHGLLERIRDLNLKLVSVISRSSADEASDPGSTGEDSQGSAAGSAGTVDGPAPDSRDQIETD